MHAAGDVDHEALVLTTDQRVIVIETEVPIAVHSGASDRFVEERQESGVNADHTVSV